MIIGSDNYIYFDQYWGLFLGAFANNVEHQHIGIQISIGLENNIVIQNKLYESVIIQGNIPHELSCEGKHLLLLVNPTSAVGHYLSNLVSEDIQEIENDFINDLKQFSIDFLTHKIEYPIFIQKIKSVLVSIRCECLEKSHFSDHRILIALKYLEDHYERVIPVEEVADICCLSPSRFLHLFKEKTGITYRKAQLWNKVSQSIPYLSKQKITVTAHQFGFTDSAHYTKVFKQTFGFSPKMIAQV